jgi:hypothetical protein
LDVERIRNVLQRIGDTKIGLQDVEALVADVRREHERNTRPGENFSVTSVTRIEHGYGPHFVVVLTDDSGNQHSANLSREDLESEQRFVFKFIRDGNLAPVLKDAYRGPHFIRFVAELVGASQAPPLKEPHGSRHGRRDRTRDAADLLLDGIKTLAATHDDYWQARPTEVYAQVTAEARRCGKLPLDWPETPYALGWRLLLAQRSGALEQAGIEFRKYRRTGQWRPTLYRFRLRKASQTEASQPA